MPHLPGEEPVASTSVQKPTHTAARPRQKRGGGRKTAQVTDLGGSGDVDEGEIKMPLFASEFLTLDTVPPPKRQSRAKGQPFAALQATQRVFTVKNYRRQRREEGWPEQHQS